MIETREWIFRVSCLVEPGENVFVSGSCNSLGCWDPQKLFPLVQEGHQTRSIQEHDSETVWTTSLHLPTENVEYRFCVCVDIKTSNGVMHAVRRWETDIHPRVVPQNVSNVDDPELLSFGYIGDFKKIDQGWLVDSHAVFLRLTKSNVHNDPIDLWKKKHKGRKCYVKLTPIDMSKTRGKEPLHDVPTEESTEVELTELRLKSKSLLSIVEVSALREGLAEFRTQDQFGILCSDEEYVVFRCIVADLESMGFLMDFYVELPDEDVPKYVGCSFALPSTLKDNYGLAVLPITSTKHIPIGQLNLSYMVVKPLKDYKCDMKVSYARHWKESWRGLEVGHRGNGNSFHSQTKNCANIRENTIASLKHAHENGADMVEFDVQLSKDHVPLIYHDFHAYISLKHKKEPSKSDLMEIPIKDLTLAQLQKLKVYHSTEKGFSRFSDDELEDHEPFPTLAQVFESVPNSCGFNIEIKWTMRLKDGTYELDHPFELNHFLDTILKVVLESGSSRKIIFSCFHPDICTMLRMKQSLYPVLFLTSGQNHKWPGYDDIRTNTMYNAILYATSANILGINVLSKDLLQNTELVQVAFDHSLVVFTWGDENSDQETIQHLKELGLHGIIYDKIDTYITKKDKKQRNVFLCDDKETCRCFPSSCKVSSPNGVHPGSPSSVEDASPPVSPPQKASPPASSSKKRSDPPSDKEEQSTKRARTDSEESTKRARTDSEESTKRARNDSEGSTGSRHSFTGILSSLRSDHVEAQS